MPSPRQELVPGWQKSSTAYKKIVFSLLVLFGSFKQEFAGGFLGHRHSEEIAIKSYAPALRPVWCFVIVYTQSGTHRAEECMLYRIDHNADVSAPDDEIAGLRSSTR